VDLVVFAGAVLLSLGALVASALLEGAPGAAKTLAVELEGELPARPPSGPESWFGEAPLTLRQVDRALERASSDETISRILLRIGDLRMGIGRSEELIRAIREFRSSGKEVVAYLEYPGLAEYSVACAADTIALYPLVGLDFRGIDFEMLYLGETLDKLGVAFDVVHIGEYKSAMENLVRATMSEAEREQMSILVQDIWGVVSERIAEARGIDPARLRELLDEGPYTGDQAIELGLVDKVLYPDEIEETIFGPGLSEEEREELQVTTRGYLDEARELELGGKKIAVVHARGAISVTADPSPFAEESGIAADRYCRIFREIREDDDIAAVVFRIDSGGGSAVASELIWREVSLTNEVKPVIASVADVAASGGYYIAAGARTILAEKGSIVGSIGVVGGKPVLKGLYEELEMNKEQVKLGRNADMYSERDFFTPEQRQKILESMGEVYQTFLKRVADNRGRSVEEIEPLARGRVYSGQRGLELGLVDRIGGFADALELARKEAGIGEEEQVRLVTYPKTEGFAAWLEELGAVRAASLPALTEIRKVRKLAELFRREPVLLLFPIEVHW
jgi:protease-4